METPPKRGYMATVLSCRCPRCREGNMFANNVSLNLKKNMEMHNSCPMCKQPTEIEVGFYYGTSYVSYAICIAISVATLVLWGLTIGLSVDDDRFIYWIISNAILLVLMQPWLMRFSRALWLSWFVKYDANWKIEAPADSSERINKEQGGNW